MKQNSTWHDRHSTCRLSCGHDKVLDLTNPLEEVNPHTQCHQCRGKTFTRVSYVDADGVRQPWPRRAAGAGRPSKAARQAPDELKRARERAATRAAKLDDELIRYALSHKVIDSASRWHAEGLTAEAQRVLLDRLALVDRALSDGIGLALAAADEGVISDRAAYAAFGERALRRID